MKPIKTLCKPRESVFTDTARDDTLNLILQRRSNVRNKIQKISSPKMRASNEFK